MPVTPEVGNTIITALSVVAGFLINLLMMIYGIVDKLRASLPPLEDKTEPSRRHRMRLEIFSAVYQNISFNILLSIVTIILCCGTIILKNHSWLVSGLSFFVYSLATLFTLTMLMILKRIYVVLSEDFPQTGAP
jgi:hypothetical protein